MAIQTITDVDLPALINAITEKNRQGARLVQICATRLPDRIELHYSFDIDFVFSSLRLSLPGDGRSVVVPSISKIYLSAFHYENEIHDLFGINIQGNVVDYKGKFYRTALKAPFNMASPEEKKS